MAKRIKRVFKNPYHIWAQKLATMEGSKEVYARNSNGNRSFKGKLAYSYHEPIARIDRYKETLFVLCRDETFSPTSSRHMAEVKRAIHGGPLVFTVAHIGGFSSWAKDYTQVNLDKINHHANLIHFREKIRALHVKTCKAKSNLRYNLRALKTLIVHANDYAQFFNLKTTFNFPVFPLTLEQLEIRATTFKARQLERDAMRLAAKKQETRAYFDRYISGDLEIDTHLIRDFYTDDPRFIAETERRLAIQLEEWKAGRTDRGGIDNYYLHRRLLAYLRVRPGMPDIVETSKQAEAPLSHVRRILRFILPMLSEGKTLTVSEAEKLPQRVGHFTLDEIDSSGNVRVGCHIFERTEVERFAKVLELM